MKPPFSITNPMRGKQVVFNKNRDKKIPGKAVYVGRPTKWGNPFRETKCRRVGDKYIHGISRRKAVRQFNLYACARLVDDPHWLDALKGRPLTCWCYPKECHANVLYHLANKRLPVKERLVREDYGYKLVECRNYEIPKDADTWRPPKYMEDWYELRCSKSGIIVFSSRSYNDAMFQHIEFGQRKG